MVLSNRFFAPFINCLYLFFKNIVLFGCRFSEWLIIVILPFMIAAFITYLFHPIVEKFMKRGLHRGLAIVLFILFFLAGLALLFIRDSRND